MPNLDLVFHELTTLLRGHFRGWSPRATTRTGSIETRGFSITSARPSPALRKRMQGKSCFNFTRVDDALFFELVDLTARCRAAQDGSGA